MCWYSSELRAKAQDRILGGKHLEMYKNSLKTNTFDLKTPKIMFWVRPCQSQPENV